MTYLNSFQEAVQRNIKLNLKKPEFELRNDRLLNNSATIEIENLFANYFNQFSEEYVLNALDKNCLSVHFFFQSMIDKILNTKSTLTFGSFHLFEDPVFTLTELEVTNRLKSPSLNKYKGHSWITLPTMEIIDISLPTTLSKASPDFVNMAYRSILKHPSDLNGMTYTPMVLGKDFLEKSGLKQDIQIFEIK